MDGIELKTLLLVFLAIMSFPQLLRRATDMVMSYHVIPYLQHCYVWVVTSSAVHNYWKCYINIVTQTCSGFYGYICTLPWALHALESHAYILVKPLATMLQYNNVATILKGRLSNIRPCGKCYALNLLLFTNDVELI